MATSLVSLVLQALTPEIIGKIASALGLDRSAVQKAVSAAVPAILAAIVGVATKPGGARRLSEAVSREGPSTLNNLGRTLEGSGYRALAEHGSGLLDSLLGSSTQSGLASALGRFAGIGEGAGSTLLGLLGPVVGATLAKQQNAQGLDASGLVNLLTSQKNDIAAAMPSGFANLLGADVLEEIGERTAARAKSAAAAAHRTVEYRAPDKRSSVNWLAWALPIIALLGLGWYLLSQQGRTPVETAVTTPQSTTQSTETATATPQSTPEITATTTHSTETAATTPGTAEPEVASLMVEGVDLGATVTSTIDRLKASLEGVTDTSTAEAALPKLEEATKALDEVSEMAGKLSEKQRIELAALIAAALPTLNPLFEKLLAIPSVSRIAKPSIDALRTELDALVTA
jgi:hypothetical protein